MKNFKVYNSYEEYEKIHEDCQPKMNEVAVVYDGEYVCIDAIFDCKRVSTAVRRLFKNIDTKSIPEFDGWYETISESTENGYMSGFDTSCGDYHGWYGYYAWRVECNEDYIYISLKVIRETDTEETVEEQPENVPEQCVSRYWFSCESMEDSPCNDCIGTLEDAVKVAQECANEINEPVYVNDTLDDDNIVDVVYPDSENETETEEPTQQPEQETAETEFINYLLDNPEEYFCDDVAHEFLDAYFEEQNEECVFDKYHCKGCNCYSDCRYNEDCAESEWEMQQQYMNGEISEPLNLPERSDKMENFDRVVCRCCRSCAKLSECDKVMTYDTFSNVTEELECRCCSGEYTCCSGFTPKVINAVHTLSDDDEMSF